LFVRRVDVAEDLGTRGFASLLTPADINLRALLLTLVVIEDAQRNIDAGASVWDSIGLLFDELYVYHPLKVGSVEPFDTANL